MLGATVRAALYFAGGMVAATVISEVFDLLLPVIAVGLSKDHQIYTSLDSAVQQLPLIILAGALIGLVARGVVEGRGA